MLKLWRIEIWEFNKWTRPLLKLQYANETAHMIETFIEERREMIDQAKGHVKRLLFQICETGLHDDIRTPVEPQELASNFEATDGPLEESASKRRTARPTDGLTFKDLELNQRRLTQHQLLYGFWALYI